MIGTRYTKELINEYISKGYWDPNLVCADFVEQCARDYPDKEAVIDSRARLTWREVNEQTDLIARGLIDMGFKKDDVIATQLTNCVEYFLLFFAMEKAGVIIASAQPTFRQAEMEPILRQVKAKAIIIKRKVRDFDYVSMVEEIRPRLPELKDVIVIGDDVPPGTIAFTALIDKARRKKRPTPLQKLFKPYEVTRIFNTSGTTGVPKCIERPIAPRIRSGKILAQRMGLKHDDVVAAGWNLAAGGTELLANVCVPLVGGKLVNIEQFSPQAVCELIQKEKITVLAAVPAEIIRALDYPDLDKYDLSSLRIIFTGTQLLTYETGVQAEQRLNCRIVIIFGSGDTGPMCSTAYSDPQEIRLRTVGLPMEGNIVEIVDEKGNVLSPGEIGEVRAQGPTLVSGYFLNPELTKQCWQDGWFYTGDAGLKDAEGHITLLGRKRDVIKRGGQIIYPFEVEAILAQHPKLTDVAIVRMPDKIMGEKQCAYVIPKKGQTFTMEEMASFLRSQKLAPYKIPERLEVVSEFPMVAAGNKVDRNRLEQDIATKLKKESGSKS